MPLLVTQFPAIVASDGKVYSTQACGVPRLVDGLWEGWLAFFDARGTAWHTGREIMMPSLPGLELWAEGLTALDLDMARRRAARATPEDAVTHYAPEAGRPSSRLSRDPIPVVLGPVRDAVAQGRQGPPVLRGRVVAADRGTGELKLRTGAHLLTLNADPSDVDGVRVGQFITVAVVRTE